MEHNTKMSCRWRASREKFRVVWTSKPF